MSLCPYRAGLGKRTPSRRTAPNLAFALLAVLILVPGLAAACKPEGTIQLQLQVTPGEMANTSSTLSIAVYANDCVHIRLPDYYRRHGSYVLALTSLERARFEDLQRAHRSLPFDQSSMLAEARAIEARRSSEAGAERFAVLDADHYALTWRDENRREQTTRALALFQYAERYPEIDSLAALQRITAALIELGEREDLRSWNATARSQEAAQ